MTPKRVWSFRYTQPFYVKGGWWITHIGGSGKYNPAIKAEMAANSPKLFIGHSHILKMFDKKYDFTYEPWRLRKKWVSSGSHHAALLIEGDKIKDLEIIEIESITKLYVQGTLGVLMFPI
jgi:hypothetical protein